MKRWLIVSFLVVVMTNLQGQQQGLLTQYMYNKVTVNPAFAGVNKSKNFAAHLREQWLGIKGSPSLQMISFDMPFMGDDNGLGFTVRRSEVGISSKTSVSGIYSYKIKTMGGMLSFGIEPILQNFKMNFGDGDLYAYDGIDLDPSLAGKTINKNSFLLGLGAYYSNTRAYFGVSSPSIFSTTFDIDQNSIKSGDYVQVNVIGGYQFEMDASKSLLIQGMSRYTSKFPINLDVNVSMLLEEKHEIGLGYRLGSGVLRNLHKSVAFTFGTKLGKQVFAAFSYDYPLSSLRNNQIGSFEVMASYSLRQKSVVNPGYNPRFF